MFWAHVPFNLVYILLKPQCARLMECGMQMRKLVPGGNEPGWLQGRLLSSVSSFLNYLLRKHSLHFQKGD